MILVKSCGKVLSMLSRESVLRLREGILVSASNDRKAFVLERF